MIAIAQGFFLGGRRPHKMILNFIQKNKCSRIAKKRIKESSGRGIASLDIRVRYKAAMKQIWYWHKNGK